MKRRNFLKTTSFGAASLAAPVLLSKVESVRKRPNILFLFADDQRFDTIRALGNPHIITPHLDSLVRNGLTFTNVYNMGGTAGAVCIPSRAMLLSGRTLFHLMGRGREIPPEHVTLPEVLRKDGYTTFQTGKWHQDVDTFTRSFSTGAKIFGIVGNLEQAKRKRLGKGPFSHWRKPVQDFDPTGKYPLEKAYVTGGADGNLRLPIDTDVNGKHSSELFTEAAIRFLKEYKEDNPFFMYVAYSAPHDPRQAPIEFHERYDPDKIPLPGNFMPEHPFDAGDESLKGRDENLAPWPRTPDIIRQHIADYYAMITHLDTQIGRVLSALEETSYAENTIIVFSSDQGLALGGHGLMGKQNLYEHSVRAPLLISGPGIPKDQKRDAFCYLLDIYPTLCDLADVTIPDSVEGKSLMSIISGQESKIRDNLFFAFLDIHRGIREDRYKLIEYVVKGKRTTQIFDLRKDPWEVNNLADDPAYAQDLKRLRKELLKNKNQLDDNGGDWGNSFWKIYGSGY